MPILLQKFKQCRNTLKDFMKSLCRKCSDQCHVDSHVKNMHMNLNSGDNKNNYSDQL